MMLVLLLLLLAASVVCMYFGPPVMAVLGFFGFPVFLLMIIMWVVYRPRQRRG